MRRSFISTYIFLQILLFGLLAGSLWLGVEAPAPWSWMVGFLYLAYDSWLLAGMVWQARGVVLADTRRLAEEASAGAVDAPLPESIVAKTSPAPTVAVLIAARNESELLPACLDALRAQTSLAEHILVIDDGSTDSTLAVVRRYAETSPEIRVLAKPHSGKADSLNQGAAILDADVFVTLDADTIMEPEALAAIRTAFAADPNLGAACGVLVPKCTPGRWRWIFEFYQRFEYLRGFLWRLAWMSRGTLLLVSGAFAAYRREVWRALDGFHPGTVVEDYDIIYRLHRWSRDTGRNFTVGVIGEARAVTDAPGTLGVFLRQRERWFSGFLQVLFRNRDMVGARHYGGVGRRMLVIKTIDAVLPLYAIASLGIILFLLARGQPLHPAVIDVLLIKFAFDLFFHGWSLILYTRWQGGRMHPRLFLVSLLASLTEPFGFQIIRHWGAVRGWASFVRGNVRWHA